MVRYCLLFNFVLLNSLAIGQSSQADLERYVKDITSTEAPRTHDNVEVLDEVAEYIFQKFEEHNGTPQYQVYPVNGKVYKNVIAHYGDLSKPVIVIGAHYDVCGPQDGADDNASGIAGILELSKLLQHDTLPYHVVLVAYTLEEPPFFRGKAMGSYVHAKGLNEAGIPVEGMIVLEMIGYFSDEKKSQGFPIGGLSLFYGNKGNFITVVKKFGAGKFARRFNRKMRTKKPLRVRTFTGPKKLPGIDFSDHLNYWKFGYSALMITDTAFYRNHNYHETTDTIETLDFEKMAMVVDRVFHTLLEY